MKTVLKKGGLILAGLLLVIIIAGQFSEDPGEDVASIDVVAERVLIPGGHSVGVQMDVKGVLVVGLEEITDESGKTVNPGLLAGLQIGDMILEVDGTKVYKAKDVEELVNEIQDTVKLKVQRKSRTITVKLTPVCTEDGLYKLGVWIKDRTAGIGTLTYYDPVNQTFGALGHAITDPETGAVLTVNQGQLLQAQVQNIKEGKSGEPGEIQGVFYETESPLGDLELNCDFGIFGKSYHPIENSVYSEPLAVGTRDQVEKGKAYILTTLENNEIQRFEIEIEKIYKRDKDTNKNMVIKVTDEKLLEQSGGIIQGMSGSPIIQNERIIGAVTHVLVNDPTRGYAIFIENMLEAYE